MARKRETLQIEHPVWDLNATLLPMSCPQAGRRGLSLGPPLHPVLQSAGLLGRERLRATKSPGSRGLLRRVPHVEGPWTSAESQAQSLQTPCDEMPLGVVPDGGTSISCERFILKII